MNQLKTAFWLVLLTVVLVLVGRLTFGVAGMYAFLGLAVVMNASAYWFSDRIALASAQARARDHGLPDEEAQNVKVAGR
jgi:heat shock protein HtpX